MPDEVKDTATGWAQILKTKFKRQLGEIGREWPHTRSLTVNLREVEKAGETGLKFSDETMENPGKAREDIWDAIRTHNLIRTKDGKEPVGLNIRFSGVGKRRLLRDLRYHDVNSLVAIEGAIVIRATEVRPRLTEAAFKCPSGHFTVKKQTSHSKFIEPAQCATDGCRFQKLDLIPKRSKYTDQQKLKIQENSEGLNPGQQPQTMDIIVLDDLCDELYPGDRATINAIVRASQRIIRGEKSTVFDLYLELSSIESEVRDYEEIEMTEEAENRIKEIAKSGNALNLITQSIAPTIWGMEDVKQAIALQMFGGVTKEHEDGQITRGEIHIFLIGDYGTAKTQLAKYACRQSPRGVFMSAVSSSGPGLIGAATRDEDGRWVVDAGALPLADKGVAGIDEIDKASKETLDVLYNVMEDGEVQISKAAKRLLKARTALIFCANPKYQKFDPYADIVDQITLPPTLTNRMDLIFIIMDTKTNDDKIIKHILKADYYGECKAAGKEERVTDEEKQWITPPIPPKLLKQYIAYAKSNVHPIMNSAAQQKIDAYYLKIRADVPDESAAPVTPRQAQSIIRLSEAMAKMRLSPEVTAKDAEAALEIFDACIRKIATDPQTGKLDMGKVGQGLSQTKINMRGAIKEIVSNEPKLTLNLLLAKMEERSFKDTDAVKAMIDQMLKSAELMEPRYEHYQVV